MGRPSPRSRKPPPPTQPGKGVRRVWGESEKAHLKTLVASALVAGEIDWKEVAAALKTNRNAKTVQTKALKLGLRAPPEWGELGQGEAQAGRQEQEAEVRTQGQPGRHLAGRAAPSPRLCAGQQPDPAGGGGGR